MSTAAPRRALAFLAVLAGCGGGEASAPSPLAAPTLAPSTTPPALATPATAAPSSGPPARPTCGPSEVLGSAGRCVACAPASASASSSGPRLRVAPGGVSLARDDRAASRQSSQQARPRQLLLTETAQLERLLRASPAIAPDRPATLRRLAESYVELADSAAREQLQAEIDHAARLRAGEAQAAAVADAKRGTLAQLVRASRASAITHYTTLVTEYAGAPSARFPASPPPAFARLDEALYYLAYEHELVGDRPSARRVYFDLVKKTPSSPFVANAYLAFAEQFFEESAADPSKWALAETAYQKVISFPPPANKVYGYALYKLAYVHWNQGEMARALSGLAKVIELGAQHAELPGAEQLAEAARKDIVPVYAAVGAPGAAHAFLRRLAGDAAGVFAMMRALGETWSDTGRPRDALAIYRDLLARSDEDDARRCEYHDRVNQLSAAAGSNDGKDAKEE